VTADGALIGPNTPKEKGASKLICGHGSGHLKTRNSGRKLKFKTNLRKATKGQSNEKIP
jgi:hypothetical protein